SPPYWSLGLFALSPVSFMVSGYHGNVDSVLVFLLLVAVWMCVEKKPVFCSIAVGLACQIKVVALILTPIFLMFWWHQKHWKSFFIITSSIIIAGWSAALFTAPVEFYK